ncbi:ribosomal protein S18-alanine N-acetyltransferase [Nocardioides sp. Kera G14]|uniref:ribosomal protein S18-alanine N-acetyltransferase n=1 Tax=Nocardioides sp. Kera G14 TaxID=2884264 RepID=UPI001D103739|nr:ribosomal protein S18-alanine N-acetyltransferase [Nocardioides sp. Kera G14]UDY24314.1 ribosomal protein S18-alanine N-acetyltransferase [Nocardioides sp. Kera G14]
MSSSLLNGESWFEIRSAEPADVEAIAASELESFPDDAWTPAYLEAVVDGQMPTVRLLALEVSDDLAGHAIISILFEDAELQRIAVLPAYRRRGFGRLLLNAAEGFSQSKGAERLLLEVRETNQAALALYRAQGYVEIDRRLGYYRDGSTGIVLEKRLELPPATVGLEISVEGEIDE